MKLLKIDEIKHIELNILKYVSKFCEENHLEYSLCAGTLLGAIRHKGFIPWDDDIDIFMPREDYKKFVELFNEKKTSVYFKALDASNTENYPYSFVKVIDRRTKLEEYRFKPYECGVYIDVFPIDSLGDDVDGIKRLNAKLDIYRKYLAFKMDRFSFYHGKKKIGLLLAKAVTAFYSRKFLISKIDTLSMSLNKEKSKYCGDMSVFTYGMREVFESEWFASYVEVEFEGNMFKAPIGYKEVLATMYGDYMELPPEKERVTHHSFDAWYVEDDKR